VLLARMPAPLKAARRAAFGLWGARPESLKRKQAHSPDFVLVDWRTWQDSALVSGWPHRIGSASLLAQTHMNIESLVSEALHSQQLWTFLGFLAGAFVTFVAALLPHWWQRRQEKKSIRAALAAEVRAISAIVAYRDYLDGLQRHIASIEREQHIHLYQVRIAMDYDIVFRSNCQKIGLLPADLSESVVRFYYLVSSAIEDIRLFNEANVDFKLRLPYRLDTAEGSLFFHQQLLALSRQIVTEGNALAQALRRRRRTQARE
jgi:hypothetical protein